MAQLSILIPARNEVHLEKTIDDICAHAEGDFEVLVGLDGWTMDFTERDLPRVHYLRTEQSIGQRAMTNRLAQLSTAPYVMKTDAHCSFGQGFDRILLEDMQDDLVMAPTLVSLNAERWQPIPKPISSAYYFDRDFVFQYHRSAENAALMNETMCLQGSAWLCTREHYWSWNLCDESYGSWGSQGVELGIQAFINSGRCVTNKRTYYAHLFREKDADFPYERDKPQMRRAHNLIKERFQNDPRIEQLVEKFGRPGDWALDTQ